MKCYVVGSGGMMVRRKRDLNPRAHKGATLSRRAD